MPKNVYADVTNKNKLTVILLAAVLALGSLVAAGVIDLKGWPGRTPEGALVDAQINATEVVQAEREEVARRQEAAATANAAKLVATSTAQAHFDQNLTAVAVAEQERVASIRSTTEAETRNATATRVRAMEVAANNATSTAYPPTATAEVVQATMNAESTAISWMSTTEAGDANATATREAENRAESREDAKVTQGWLIAVLIFLAFASSVASIILIVRIWFIHIKPLVGLKKRVTRLNSLADMLPEVCRRLQEMEERAYAEKQGDAEVPQAQES